MRLDYAIQSGWGLALQRNGHAWIGNDQRGCPLLQRGRLRRSDRPPSCCPVLACQRDACSDRTDHPLHQLPRSSVKALVGKAATGKFSIKPWCRCSVHAPALLDSVPDKESHEIQSGQELWVIESSTGGLQTIRRWGRKFGPDYARRLRRKEPSGNDVWHSDEVVVTIAGKKNWIWRAVDQDGYVLDEVVQNRWNTEVARRLLARLLKKQGIAPKRMIADRLRSYGAARRQVMPHVELRSHKGLNNRAENSHVPLRKRERMMQGFRSPGGLQRFISVFSAIRNLFVSPRSQRSASQNRVHRIQANAERKAAAAAIAMA